MSKSRADGRYRFVNSKDVAERAGVSRSAVSRAFTPGASIAPKTLRKVIKAAEALGYEVNDLARGLLAHRSQLVGLVASDPGSPFRAQIIAALAHALIERGNVPAIINVGPTPEDLAHASRQLLRYRAEATIFLSGSPPSSLVETTRRNGQTLVLIDRAETGLDSVRCDDRNGAKQAFEALRDTGASRLAVVCSANPSPSLLAREKAFVQFAEEAGIAPMSIRIGRSDYESGRDAASKLVTGGLAPEAVFCVNDLMAFGVLDALRGRGLRVPADTSVIGFDDVPMAAWSSYRLTTLRQDPGRIAKEVTAILDRRRANPGLAPISVRFSPDLVVRSTVKAPIM